MKLKFKNQAETKGTLEEMKLKGIEKAKIECAGKFFSALGTKGVQYHVHLHL